MADGSQRAAAHDPDQPMSALLEAALAFAAGGWHVFPAQAGHQGELQGCQVFGRPPMGRDERPGRIKRDWQRWPDANIGIACGPGSGMFVVEGDTLEGHGVDGVGNFAALIAQHGGIPATRAPSRRGGPRPLAWRWPA